VTVADPAALAVPSSATAVREHLAASLPAARAALLVAGERDGFALTGGWAGVAAVVGAAPRLALAPGADPFAALTRLPALAADSDARVAVGGGWFGALGYALASRVEPTVPAPPRRLHLPAATLAFYDHVLVCDRRGGWWFEALSTPPREAALRERRDELAARLAAAPRPRRVRLRDVRLRAPGAAGHRAAVAACRERIEAGEIFQASLCLHLDATLDGRPADLAVAAAEALAPAHGAFLVAGWGAVVSASPELFLRRTNRDVRSEPIKGTALAGDSRALAGSAKDRAENVMIVDLMRNDLGRVCTYGSVRVGALAEARLGTGVTHLVSEISGKLRSGVGDDELLRATFPPGSVTGAPKVQALRVIAELEGSAREVYTGAVGYVSPVAGLELSVAIRTFEIVGAQVQLGVGGGITARSDPDAELAECLVKARPLLALGGAEVPVLPVALTPAPLLVEGAPGLLGAGAPASLLAARLPEPLPVALLHGRERPDPARGLFETLRIRAGVADRLAEHLARLRASAAAHGVEARDDLGTKIVAAANDLHAGRLRIDLHADGGSAITTGPLPRSDGPVALAPCLLPGGLGAHKWADRRLLDAMSVALGAVPLLVDADGAVLEAAWASVWIGEGDRLITPPADGRVLPGVTRAALLAEDARCEEGPVSLDRLRRADALWVSSALRGLTRARLRAGAARPYG
jgi:para-aminobenzoate synthetase/4-amino-4-deoxychorismate lyase